VRDYFARQGLSCLFEHDPRGTQRHVNLMAHEGGRISIYIEPGTFEPTIDLAKLERVIANSDYVVLNIVNYCRHLIPLARRHHKPIWCDIHDYDGHNPYHQDFIDSADFLFMSSDAMPQYRSFMESQIRRGKKLAICTHGSTGATALANDGEWIEMSALTEYPVVDTNGAGDRFSAGVLYGYVHAYPLTTCLRLGAVMGALSVTSQELVSPDLSVARLQEEYACHYGEPYTSP
jgi:acarbose 7IV-phosphotransferase